MRRKALRPLGGDPYPEKPPMVTVGRSAQGRPIVVIQGGHRLRRAEGLSFEDPALLRELVADLNIVLAEWPDG